MKPSIFRAVADRLATDQTGLEKHGEWSIVPTEWIVGHVSSAEVLFDGQHVTAIHCYGKDADWLYTMIGALIKACSLYESAVFNRQFRHRWAA